MQIVKHTMSMGVIYDTIQHHYISMHDSHLVYGLKRAKLAQGMTHKEEVSNE